jgi:hypothetical protein
MYRFVYSTHPIVYFAVRRVAERTGWVCLFAPADTQERFELFEIRVKTVFTWKFTAAVSVFSKTVPAGLRSFA